MLMTAKVLNQVEEVPVEGTKVLCRATEGADGNIYWVLEDLRRRTYGDAKVIIIDPMNDESDDGRPLAQLADPR